MITVLLNLSKYILMFFMLFYTFICFKINALSDEKKLKGHLVVQKIFTYLIFAICYGIILYKKFDIMTLIVFMLEFLYIMVFPALFDVIYENDSKLITNNMTFLLALGFVMVMRLSPGSAIKQFIIVAVGTILFFIIPNFMKKREKLIKSRFLFAIIGIALLLITLVLGKTSFGANLSFTIGGLTFQPSEFVKLLFVLFLAGMLYKNQGRKDVLISGIFAAAHVLILVASTDLGGALIFCVVYLIMVYVSTGKLRYMLVGLVAGSAASVVAYKLFSHVRVRIAAWLDPWSDIDNKGYQITQSLFAIGTGGWFGMGLYEGLPTSIPVVNKDFVFSAIAEELGIVFAICLILVCVSIFLENMKFATKCEDPFYRLIIAGFGVMYIFQCFLTIGGVTKFIPSTGVTLPFVSYGGSSILGSLIMFSMIQSVIIRIKEDGTDAVG